MSQSSSGPTALSLEEKRRLLVQQLQKKAERGNTFPLSFAQQRLWMVHQMDPASAAYNIPYALRLRGTLDTDALGRALTDLVRRHESLRTVFPAEAGVPMQLVRPAAPLVPAVRDLRPLPAAAREDEAARLAREEATRPFDLATGPLLRVTLLRLADDEAMALFTMHHVVGDGWSQDVLVRDLSELYTAACEGRDAHLPPLPIQYADYASWQRGWLTGDVLRTQLDYWRDRLAGAPPILDLPTDRPRAGSPGTRADSHPFLLSARTSEALRALSLREGATPFITLLAAFQALLARWSGQDDVVVGTPVAGRSRMEVENLIGFFVNLLALRTDVGGAPTFRALLGRVREGVLQAHAHQDLPFEKLVDEVQPARNLTNTPLFQVLFSYQPTAQETLRLGDLEVERVPGAAESAKYDLSLSMGDDGERMGGQLTYRAALFDAGTVARMAEQLERLLDAVAADPDVRPSALDLLGEAERHRLVVEWNRTERPYPAGRCIHELVDGQAARTPHAVALACGGRTMTYGEMAARSNRLAHRLMAMGVRPEDRVALCLEAGLGGITGLLGIMKAGGAYVPVDVASPDERIEFILAESGARVVVTETQHAGRAWTAGREVIPMDRAEAFDAFPDTPPAPRVTDAHLAYVLYTSGSTGRPKGVLVPHAGVCNVVADFARVYRMEAGDRHLLLAPLHFDSSVVEMFATLVSGAALHAPHGAEVYPGREQADLLVRERITHAKWTPSALAALPEVELPDMKVVITGGEACPAELVARWLPGRRFVQSYGPTETTVRAAVHECTDEPGRPPLGRPIANAQVYILDRAGRLVPAGVAGELCVGGIPITRGYLGRPGLTADRFVPDPFGARPGGRLYRTGDRARWRADGLLEFIGRFDHQVKIRGFRIEPGEIEAALRAHAGVVDCAVLARQDAPGDARLVAYVVGAADAETLRAHLRQRLPEHMVPAAFVPMDQLPLTSNGKLDHRALPAPAHESAPERGAAPRTPIEARVAEVWREVLGIETVGREEGFFELGGHSLLIVRLQARLRERLGRDVSIVDLFRHPTIAALARHLEPAEAPSVDADRAEAHPLPRVRPSRPARKTPADADGGGFAIIGMAGRFPGAADVEAFWRNLRDGVESISFFSDEEMRAAGVPAERLADPSFVRAGGVMEGSDQFDAEFFGFSPREAEILDPQHRVFLETAWEALESAGYAPGTTDARIGIFAGSSISPYLTRNVLSRPDLVEAVGFTQVKHGNDKDFLATRAAHRLNLRGPALNLQTGCSTGLVAVHLACQALANGDCGMAVAGGVSVRFGGPRGYRYAPGGIASPDGHTRAFDARAAGTVDGNGIGLVVLKRLADARADGDTIHAVVRGTAINNDGAAKVGFTAPSVEGQAEVIADALAAADVDPRSIGYVEAHGSGTELGDPIEVAALTQAFGPTDATQFCALGSVKTSIGHLDAAAGAAGLIKAALAVSRGEIPASLHYTTLNPNIDFASSPFFVNARLRPWETDGGPRRAGVSSFGVGGTNAHVVLEQAPEPAPSPPSRDWQLLALSARTPEALEAATDRLAAHLRAHPEQPLADVAWTLQAGRRAFPFRRGVVAREGADAADALARRAGDRVFGARAPEGSTSAAFLVPGLGNQHPGMGRGLYETEPLFRQTVDECAEILRPLIGLDLRAVLYPTDGDGAEGVRAVLERAEQYDPAEPMKAPRLGHTALFVTQYALARQWMRWGVRPVGMMGYSLGEFVAAAIAGVWSLEDALALTAERALLVEQQPAGAVMGIGRPPEDVRPLLGGALDLFAFNGPGITVVAGPVPEVEALQAELAERRVRWRRLAHPYALHSRMMRPVAERLEERMRGMRMHAPRIPFVSNVTGTWIRDGEATDPAYWTRHLCGTVRFHEGVMELVGERRPVLLELGSGHGLRMLTRQLKAWEHDPPEVIAALRHGYERVDDGAHLAGTMGRLWAAGVDVDWTAVHGDERPRRVPLPTYPFERRRYWLDPLPPTSSRAAHKGTAADANGLWVPAWTRAPLPAAPAMEPAHWLVLADARGIGGGLAGRLEARGHAVAVVEPNGGFSRVGDRGYTARPGYPADFAALREALDAAGIRPSRVVHLWDVDAADADDFDGAQARGPATLAALASAFARDGEALRMIVVTDGAQDVAGGEPVDPARAAVLGACRALTRDHPHVPCRAVDVRIIGGVDAIVDQLLAEVTADVEDAATALRGRRRWTMDWQPAPVTDASGLRRGGAYVVTGALAGGADALARHLAGTMDARLAVVVGPAFPGREAWDAHLAHAPADDAAAIRAVRAAEAGGARVLLLRAAPDDADALRDALRQASDAFGGIDGVLHGMASAASAAPIGNGAEDGSEPGRIHRALAALHAATAGIPLGFVLLLQDGAGHAGALADAWAQRAVGDGARWISVAWDGAAPDAALPPEAATVFARLAALDGEPRVVASAHPPDARIRTSAPSSAVAESASPAVVAAAPLHPRPTLTSTYHPPTNPAEETLAGVWRELLGIEQIGIHDDFFHLGGHSLLGMKVVSRVREAFAVELPLRAVFEAPTVATLAALVEEAIRMELEEMSEDEAAALAGEVAP